MKIQGHVTAYNFARRLKALNGLTPYEYIAKIWTSEPERFILDPIHQMTGLNTSNALKGAWIHVIGASKIALLAYVAIRQALTFDQTASAAN